MNTPSTDRQRRLVGKFRGIVVNNDDPEHLGRIQAQVPAVDTATSAWAMPCVPYAGPGIGFHFIPAVGSRVWIEFEGGDPSFPIWVGAFWGPGELPEAAVEHGAEIKLIATTSNTLMLDDTPGSGGVRITSEQPAVDQPATAIITPV